MTDMMKDLKEAIAKNLPAAVGTELKQRLEQAEKDERDLAAYKNKCENLEASLRAVQEMNSKLSKEVADARAREIALTAREREIQKLELTAQFEKEKTDLVRSMFSTVFQNRTIREGYLSRRVEVVETSQDPNDQWKTNTRTTTKSETRDPVDIEEG